MKAKFTGTDPFQTRQINPVSLALFLVFVAGGTLAAITAEGRVSDSIIATIVIAMMVIGFYLLFALKIANQWEKAVVLRFGRFRGLRGPGLFWMVPLVDTIPAWVDHRVTVTPFNAEKTLTKEATQKHRPLSSRKSRRASALFRLS